MPQNNPHKNCPKLEIIQLFIYTPPIIAISPKNAKTNEDIKENLLPLTSARGNRVRLPTMTPKYRAAWMVDRSLLLSQYRLLKYVAVKLFYILHWLIILQAFYSLVYTPSQINTGFMKTNMPIKLIHEPTSQHKLMKTISIFWYFFL